MDLIWDGHSFLHSIILVTDYNYCLCLIFDLFYLSFARSRQTDMRRLERELYEVNLLRKQASDDQE